jgi:hypothetical protein
MPRWDSQCFGANAMLAQEIAAVDALGKPVVP